jgi:ribonuclease E
MANKMLIDASHPEETRVVVLRGNRVEEFDFEAASKKQLRGNIYLAKVMRVEPSLQAAFVDYGGNRHGFLAFSEIHPDYYQIPVADRQALIEEEARAQRDEEEDVPRSQRRSRRFRRGDRNGPRAENRSGADSTLSEAYVGEASGDTEVSVSSRESEEAPHEQFEAEQATEAPGLDAPEETARLYPHDSLAQQDPGSHQAPPGHAGAGRQGRARQQGRGADDLSVAGRPLRGPDAQHRARRRHQPQDHLGAGSLPAEGSGAQDLDVPEGMGVILRTAGASRTKPEIKRDFEYLLRMWETVRDMTLNRPRRRWSTRKAR